jgi:hypothetical protein
MLNSCTNSSQKSIVGTWTMLSDYYGLVEKTFTDDNTVITRHYYGGGNPDYERTEEYVIIDDILFIEASAFNYHLIDNKLFVSWRGDTNEIYTRKTNEEFISENKKFLVGHWTGYKLEMMFFGNGTVNIKEYGDKNIVTEDYYDYEITEKYIILKDIEKENNFSEFLNQYLLRYGIYIESVYKVKKDSGSRSYNNC